VVVASDVGHKDGRFDPISCVYWIIPAYRTRPAFGPPCP
jgi:hypothetical protein